MITLKKIGNLPPDVRTKDIEDLFYKYGKIKYIDLKSHTKIILSL